MGAEKEEMAKRLEENRASVFGKYTATYEEWLDIIEGTMTLFSHPDNPKK